MSKSTKWYRLNLENYKPMEFPQELQGPIVEAFEKLTTMPDFGPKPEKHISPSYYQEEEKLYLDAGGMCHAEMETMAFDLPGIKLEMPARDVELYLGDLKNPQDNGDLSVPYHSLQGQWIKIGLTPAQVEMLIPQLEERLKEATELAKKEWSTLTESISDINKKAGRTVALPPVRAVLNSADVDNPQ